MITYFSKVLLQLSRADARERALRIRNSQLVDEVARLQNQVEALTAANDWQADIINRIHQKVPGVLAQVIEVEL